MRNELEGYTQCESDAYWILSDKNHPYDFTFSCTDHLQEMATMDIDTITRHYGDEICCLMIKNEKTTKV